MSKQPSFQFYPGDWLKDPALQSCCASAIGAYINLLCYAFECEPRGCLVTNGTPWSIQTAAKMGKVKSKMVLELVSQRVLRLSTRRGILFSARMVRDERLRRQKQRSGRHGGQAKWKQDPKQNGSKPQAEGLAKPKTSSSSSASAINKNPPNPPLGGIQKKIFDALVEEFHSDGIGPSDERSLRKALPDFERLCGQNPDMIATRALQWRARGNQRPLTPQLLRKHWSALKPDIWESALTEEDINEANRRR